MINIDSKGVSRDASFIDISSVDRSRDAVLIDVSNTLSEKEYSQKPVTSKDVKELVAMQIASDPFSTIATVAVVGAAGALAAPLIGLSAAVGSAFGVATASSGMAGLEYMNALMSKDEKSRRDFWTEYADVKSDYKSNSDFSQGVGKGITLGTLPQGLAPDSISASLGDGVGTIATDLTIGALFGGSFIAGAGINALISSYNESVGMDVNEETAFKGAIAHGLGTALSTGVFLKAAPYVNKTIGNVFSNSVTAAGIKSVAIGAEFSGWGALANKTEEYGRSLLSLEKKEELKFSGSETAALFTLGFVASALLHSPIHLAKGMAKRTSEKINDMASRGIIKASIKAENVETVKEESMSILQSTLNKYAALDAELVRIKKFNGLADDFVMHETTMNYKLEEEMIKEINARLGTGETKEQIIVDTINMTEDLSLMNKGVFDKLFFKTGGLE